MNSVHLIGNLTRDVEAKTLSSGAKVAKLSLAINRYRKGASGRTENETCFIEAECWGRTAETASAFLKRGSKVAVSGFLKQESWQDKNGNNRSRHLIFAEKIEFLSTKSNNNARVQQSNAAQELPHKPPQEILVEFVEDEIPF